MKPLGVLDMAAPAQEVVEPLTVRGELPAALAGAFVQALPHGVSGIRLAAGTARWYRGERPPALARENWSDDATMARPVCDGVFWHTAVSYPGLGCAEHLTLTSDGEVVRVEPFVLHGTPMMRAVALTDRFFVVFDSPPYYSHAAALVGLRSPYVARTGQPTRIGLLPRDGVGQPCWFEVGGGEVLQAVNAHDGLGRVVVDAVWAPGVLRRSTIDLTTGEVRTTSLSGMDVATVDDRVAGRRHRHVFGLAGRTVVRHDVVLDRGWTHELRRPAGQPVFAPRGRREGDGWLVVLAGDELVVLDAEDVAGPPVAVVVLPFEPPVSRRATWLPERPWT
ncbi:carotenoid oxygenase family protein [Saccharothrix deserti]|uniref:carotenoid oxygenase family protein n=1 Tax=Saccharothrix deserti TaxID=2593674 RepID=UPI00131C552F|nr:carotenoid oxygenase family protein [Saccharothrix deserti]